MGTVRTRYKIEAAISSSSAEERDLGNLKFEVVDDTQGEGGTRRFKLSGSVVDYPLELGNVTTAKLVTIRTSPSDPNDVLPEIRIKLNGGSEYLSIKPLGTQKEAHFLISTNGVTSITATNTGTVGVDLTLGLAGD
jgi:hypothetical protein